MLLNRKLSPYAGMPIQSALFSPLKSTKIAFSLFFSASRTMLRGNPSEKPMQPYQFGHYSVIFPRLVDMTAGNHVIFRDGSQFQNPVRRACAPTDGLSRQIAIPTDGHETFSSRCRTGFMPQHPHNIQSVNHGLKRKATGQIPPVQPQLNRIQPVAA